MYKIIFFLLLLPPAMSNPIFPKAASEATGIPAKEFKKATSRRIITEFDKETKTLEVTAHDASRLKSAFLDGGEDRNLQMTWSSEAPESMMVTAVRKSFGEPDLYTVAEIWVGDELLLTLDDEPMHRTGNESPLKGSREQIDAIREITPLETARKIADSPTESVRIVFKSKSKAAESRIDPKRGKRFSQLFELIDSRK